MKVVLITGPEAEGAMARYARATNQITKLDAEAKEKIKNIETLLATSKHEHAEEAAKAQVILKTYADQNPQLFTDKKSIDLPGGSIGFRAVGTSVAISPNETEDTVIKKLEKYLPAFVKTVKTMIKGGLNQQPEKILKKCGLELQPGEDKFFVKAL